MKSKEFINDIEEDIEGDIEEETKDTAPRHGMKVTALNITPFKSKKATKYGDSEFGIPRSHSKERSNDYDTDDGSRGLTTRDRNR